MHAPLYVCTRALSNLFLVHACPLRHIVMGTASSSLTAATSLPPLLPPIKIGTPVYMCPQLISSKNSKAGYDAVKADIWACGVLLFVMLLGMFPYGESRRRGTHMPTG